MVVERQGFIGLLTGRWREARPGTTLWPDGSVTEGYEKTQEKVRREFGRDRLLTITAIDDERVGFRGWSEPDAIQTREAINSLVDRIRKAYPGSLYQDLRWRPSKKPALEAK